MGKINDIFTKALNLFRNKSDSAQAASDLDKGKAINLNMRSDRYTYDNLGDSEHDKDWSPRNKAEKDSLSPEGYFRQGERSAEKQSRLKDIYDSALRQKKAEAEEESGRRLSQAKQKKLEDEAEKEAENEFNDEFREKQISVPSTAIASIQYDPDTEGLEVQFTSSNKKYFYPGVPLELVQAMLKAPSKGEFFMQNIHDQYSMNKSHKPVGQSPTYGKQSRRKVDRFYRKYVKAYKKNNKGRWSEGEE